MPSVASVVKGELERPRTRQTRKSHSNEGVEEKSKEPETGWGSRVSSKGAGGLRWSTVVGQGAFHCRGGIGSKHGQGVNKRARRTLDIHKQETAARHVLGEPAFGFPPWLLKRAIAATARDPDSGMEDPYQTTLLVQHLWPLASEIARRPKNGI